MIANNINKFVENMKSTFYFN